MADERVLSLIGFSFRRLDRHFCVEDSRNTSIGEALLETEIFVPAFPSPRRTRFRGGDSAQNPGQPYGGAERSSGTRVGVGRSR